MEHPFLSTEDLAKYTLEDLQSKISELNKKLSVVYNTNSNQYLIHQLSMALDSYNEAMRRKIADLYPTTDKNFDKIDIS